MASGLNLLSGLVSSLPTDLPPLLPADCWGSSRPLATSESSPRSRRTASNVSVRVSARKKVLRTWLIMKPAEGSHGEGCSGQMSVLDGSVGSSEEGVPATERTTETAVTKPSGPSWTTERTAAVGR